MKRVIRVILLSFCILLLSSCNKQNTTVPTDNTVDKKVETDAKTRDVVTNDFSKFVGIYKYEYEDNTEDWTEDQYIVLENVNGKIGGRYYGTTDDFDDEREGYLPGFFVSNMKDLQVKESKITFSIQLQESDLFSKPVDLKYKSSEEVPTSENPKWVNGKAIITGEKNTKNYKGKIAYGKIKLETKSGPIIFNKVQ
jgi:hypothetical protein